ncbi:MAG: hypothetical protein ACXV2C_00770 [Candidatus Bathyarchaeia archaeon]
MDTDYAALIQSSLAREALYSLEYDTEKNELLTREFASKPRRLQYFKEQLELSVTCAKPENLSSCMKVVVVGLTEKEKVIMILDHYLKHLGGTTEVPSLTKFVHNVEKGRGTKIPERFFNAIHWSFLTKEFIIPSDPELVNAILFNALAETLDYKELFFLIGSFSERETIRNLVAFYQELPFQEGGFLIHSILKKDDIFRSLISFLDTGYYSKKTFYEIWSTKSLEEIQTLLNAKSVSTLKIFLNFFSSFNISDFHDLSSQHYVLMRGAMSLIPKETMSTYLTAFAKHYGLFGGDFMLASQVRLMKTKNPNRDYCIWLDRRFYEINNKKQHLGMKYILFALPTIKYLPNLFFVESLINGLEHAQQFYLDTGITDDEISKSYFIVIDQSKHTITNKQYLSNFNHPKLQIIHVDKDMTIKIAKHINQGIELMIRKKEGMKWGYGGARNAVFLLSPVISWAFEFGGAKCIEDILQIPKDKLKRIFKSHVLESKNGLRNVISMGDDDTYITPATVIEQIFYANQVEHEYAAIKANRKGRNTNNNMSSLPITALYELPTSSIRYETKLISVGMDCSLSKPRFCFPATARGEEISDGLKLTSEHMPIQPSIHLCGNRIEYGDAFFTSKHLLSAIESTKCTIMANIEFFNMDAFTNGDLWEGASVSESLEIVLKRILDTRSVIINKIISIMKKIDIKEEYYQSLLKHTITLYTDKNLRYTATEVAAIQKAFKLSQKFLVDQKSYSILFNEIVKILQIPTSQKDQRGKTLRWSKLKQFLSEHEAKAIDSEGNVVLPYTYAATRSFQVLFFEFFEAINYLLK